MDVKINFALKIKVWNNNFGPDSRNGACRICQKNIKLEDFNCALIDLKKPVNIDNLWPICDYCNSSRGNENLIKFRQDLIGKGNKLQTKRPAPGSPDCVYEVDSSGEIIGWRENTLLRSILRSIKSQQTQELNCINVPCGLPEQLNKKLDLMFMSCNDKFSIKAKYNKTEQTYKYRFNSFVDESLPEKCHELRKDCQPKEQYGRRLIKEYETKEEVWYMITSGLEYYFHSEVEDIMEKCIQDKVEINGHYGNIITESWNYCVLKNNLTFLLV